MKGKKQIPYESILLAAIVSAVWTLACALKGIYPFGDYVLSVGDMREQSIPVYTFLWDVMHGQKSLFFDWDIGLGNNMAGVVSHFTLISPFNLFLLLIKRSAVETAMFYFFLIKIIAIALGVRFVFRRWFPDLNRCLLYAFCILYTFCPFLVEYYRIPSWYDIAFVFPFVMYFYVEMMNGRQTGLGYSLCLAVFGIMTFQHTYMLAILLILMTGGLLIIDRNKYGCYMLRWIGMSVLAAMFSACVLLPGALQIMTAGRLDDSFDFMAILESIYIFFPAKWSKLINLGIPFGLLLCGWRKTWKKREFWWLLYVDMLMLLPIGLESTNMLWHGGPYEGYTMRFSYMLTFWVVVTGMYSYQRSRETSRQEVDEERERQAGKTILLLAVLIVLGIVLYYMAVSKTSIVLIILIVLLTMMIGGNVLGMDDARYSRVILLAAVMVSIAMLPHNIILQYNKDNSDVRFYNTVRVKEKEADRPVLDRIKNMDISSQNYPQLLNRSAIGNYTASEGVEQIYSVVDMGYALVGNRMSDWGGTIFSDALLGTTEVITTQEVSEQLYTKKTSEEEYQIYDCNYVYENGILIQRDYDMSVKEEENPFLLQNEMAVSILGEELFTLYEVLADTVEIPIEEESILYGYVPGIPNPAITVNVIEIMNIETGKTTERKIASGWDNGIINLGIYDGQSVCIRVERAKDIGTMYFALLPLAKLKEYEPVYAQNFQYTTSNHTLRASLEVDDEGERLFLPIYHDEGWKCWVNGESVNIDTFLSGGMVIPLVKGENHISLRYYPSGFKLGILCSFLGGILLIVHWRLSVLGFAITEKLQWPAGYFILTVWGILMVVFYLLPVIFLVKFVIQKILS